MISHGALLDNLRMIREAFGLSEQSVGLSWLPLYHDMGLIGGVLQTLFLGARTLLMSPAAFAQKPLRWLQAIDRFGVTVSGGPNFAYAVCADQITAEQAAGLELSRWSLAFCGAEPVRAETIDRFEAKFSAQGFRRGAFYPCYGIAEGTLLVSGSQHPQRPRIFQIDRQRLQSGRFELSTGSGSQPLVGCGKAWAGQEIVIVAPSSMQECSPGHIGEIWVKGDSVAAGYWGRPEASVDAFQARLAGSGRGPYLRTGDLGVIFDDELVCTGRLKEMIIVRGRNHYPQDIELTACRAHPSLRGDGGAAFAFEVEGMEQVVIVQEVSRGHLKRLDAKQVFTDIRRSVWEEHEIQLQAVVLIRPATLPRTSSGKAQRTASRELFLSGGLSVVAEWRAPTAIPPNGDGSVEPSVRQHSNRSAVEIERRLVEAIVRRLGVPSDGIDPHAPMAELGLDPFDAVALAAELQSWLGVELPATIAFDHPSIRSLATHLAHPGTPNSGLLARPNDRQGRNIAIVGMACRLPGASSPEAYWSLLEKGIDAIREIPAERWAVDLHFDAKAGVPGKMNTRWGGFIESVDLFDPAFFGIAPTEAAFMDPQQRLLLEVAWEALERAGVRPRSLAGSRTGVFVGISNSDYAQLQRSDAARLSAYFGTGNSFSVAANRISYLLDLQGPSWAVDTSCSSSLVAAHQACESLRRGESDLALVGGVNLILTPEVTIALSQAGMMSPSGRCKTFSADADGYVRGEGCGVVVLKRWEDAQKDGDRVLALIRGSAVNHDGRTNGLTAPNGRSQQTVIRRALADAGLEPAAIGYVETHGTGTVLGDPIEVDALCEVLGRERMQPCWLGAVKANIGHLESASGVASLIKAALVLQHAKAPPQLHLGRINPLLADRDETIAIPRELSPLPVNGEVRRAGVSAFSFGGTNAHLILEEASQACDDSRRDVADRTHHLLTLSARDEKALREYAARFAAHLRSTPNLSLADACYTANVGREHFEHRLAAVAGDVESFAERLDSFARGGQAPDVFVGHAPMGAAQEGAAPQEHAFLFTGQGAQYPGMGATLYRTSPIFRDAIDACDRLLRPVIKQSLVDRIYGEDADPAELNRAEWAQPAIFALQYALTQLWRSFGVAPAAVMGHSVGEYAAAWAAGCLDWEKALLLVAERGRLMQSLPAGGAMWSVRAGAERLRPALAQCGEVIEIAAINSPHNTVVAGPTTPLQALVDEWRRAGIDAAPLNVSHAYHSSLIEPALDALEAAADRLGSRPPRLPFVSNVTGDFVQTPLDARYWRRHSRESVRFMDGVRALHARGHWMFIEIGAQPVLSALGQQCIGGLQPVWLPSLSRQREDWAVLLGSLAELHVRGLNIDWSAFDQPYQRRMVDLPTYPFQRQSYWLKTMTAVATHPGGPASSSEEHVTPPLPGGAQMRDAVVDELKSLLSRILGIPSAQIDEHKPFLLMGADSLMLMLAIQSIEKRFAVTVTVRQVFEELNTLSALAQYIVEHGQGVGIANGSAATGPLPPLLSTLPRAAEETQAAEPAAQTAPVRQPLSRQLELIAQHVRVLETGEHAAPSDLSNVELLTWQPVRTDRRPLDAAQERYLRYFVSRFVAKSSQSRRVAEDGRRQRADLRGVVGYRPEIKEILLSNRRPKLGRKPLHRHRRQ